jgi:hypothetical protein
MTISGRCTVRHVAWRLAPARAFDYFIALFERVNVGMGADDDPAPRAERTCVRQIRARSSTDQGRAS